MGSFGYRDGIAVMQIFFFTVYLGCGILLCTRHGWGKQSGFIVLITFSLLRLVGSGFQLATINFPSTTTYTGAAVCEAIGIAPLTIINVSMLARLNRFLPLARQMGKKVFGIISALSIVAISVAIKGGIDGESADGKPSVFTQVAMVIFVVVFVIAVAIFATLVPQRDQFPKGEKRLLVSFAACAPFIIVRLIYGLIADFGNNPDFHLYKGNTTIWLCMAVLEEIIAMAIVITVGLTLKPVPKFEAVATEEVELGRGDPKFSRPYGA